MLALLHVAVFRGVQDPWARALLLAHLGVVLLWQPFLRAEQRVSPVQGFILSLVAFAVMMQLDWWLLAFWVVVLAGLVGGKVYQQHARWQRRCYLAGAAVSARAARRSDPARDRAAPGGRSGSARCGRVLRCRCIFVLIALIPAEPDPPEQAQIIDFFYSVFLMLLLGRGDPGQLRADDGAPDRLPGGAHLHRLHDRGRGAARRPRVEPARRIQRAQRVLRALSLLDRPAGGEMAAFSRRARAARAAPRALPRRGGGGAAPAALGRGRALARRRFAGRAGRGHARAASSSRTARSRSPCTRASA